MLTGKLKTQVQIFGLVGVDNSWHLDYIEAVCSTQPELTSAGQNKTEQVTEPKRCGRIAVDPWVCIYSVLLDVCVRVAKFSALIPGKSTKDGHFTRTLKTEAQIKCKRHSKNDFFPWWIRLDRAVFCAVSTWAGVIVTTLEMIFIGSLSDVNVHTKAELFQRNVFVSVLN